MAKFGENFQVYTEAKRGGRNYMEDVVCVKIHRGSEDDSRVPERDLAYLAIFDGHGGPEAAEFAKEKLLDEITKQRGFWTDDDEQVTRAIKDGFISTQKLMWKAAESWPKTVSGLPSTAGTTASIVIVRKGKMYVAHVGDSCVVIGTKKENSKEWAGHCVTKEHKPDSTEELHRIQNAGGQVVTKAGVARVVWKRPLVTKGPVRRNTLVDNIPFLAVARSLGDFWSYNSERDVFVVSPEPDVSIYDLDFTKHRCIIIASDGIWNMIGAEEAVDIVSSCFQKGNVEDLHPASVLVQLALERWQNRQIRADNTSAIIVLINPPGESIYKSVVTGKPSLIRTQPANSSLLPLCQNLLSPSTENRLELLTCGKGGEPANHNVLKEDRMLIKRLRLRRKFPGMRIRKLSIGSQGGVVCRLRPRLASRRHTLPASFKNIREVLDSEHSASKVRLLDMPENLAVLGLRSFPDSKEKTKGSCDKSAKAVSDWHGLPLPLVSPRKKDNLPDSVSAKTLISCHSHSGASTSRKTCPNSMNVAGFTASRMCQISPESSHVTSDLSCSTSEVSLSSAGFNISPFSVGDKASSKDSTAENQSPVFKSRKRNHSETEENTRVRPSKRWSSIFRNNRTRSGCQRIRNSSSLHAS